MAKDKNLIPMTTQVNDEIIDLDLSVTRKKRFRFDKDNSRIVELNTSDMNIMARVSEAYPKLQALQDKASKIMDGLKTGDDVSEEESMADLKTMAERLTEVDKEMRELIDFIFNADVSEAAAPDGSMYDPFNGSFRFEYIITLLIQQYENNLQREYSKMEREFKKHTDKYTRG